MKERTAYIAGGCFWGLQDLIQEQPGVLSTEVGYTGGTNQNPTYENHPGHAEAIAVTFDESVTVYKNILDYFFRIHDPSTPNRQGNDIGDSYRSAIFYQSDEELRDAKDIIDMVNNSGLYTDPVATTLEPFTVFWSAEEYHQDYLKKHPGGYTCHFLRSDDSLLQ
jgi:peptide-methionine (S)-S-oxide reductase